MDAERLSSLVGDLYEAALDPGQADRLGPILCQAMGVGSCIMFLTEHPSGRMIDLVSSTPNFDAAARRDYAAHYHARNPWYLTAVGRTPPYVARGEELIDYPAFERTEFCADWCSRMDIFHMIGGVVPVRPGVVVGSGIHKTRRQGAFSDPEKHHYALLMRHLARSLQVADRMSAGRNGAALDQAVVHGLAVGVMLVDRERRIVQANAIAERLLRSLRWFSARHGVVQPVHPADRDAFARRVASAAGAGNGLGAGGPMQLRDPVDRDLAVLVAPFRSAPGGHENGRLSAIVFADPDARTPPPPTDIARVLGVSRAEAELVSMLAGGATLVEAARAIGISVNTAKTQLKSVFQKTGARRQADIIERVIRDPVLQLSARWKEQGPDPV
jgi:DNA-binding CsgD family transcriptional regulator